MTSRFEFIWVGFGSGLGLVWALFGPGSGTFGSRLGQIRVCFETSLLFLGLVLTRYFLVRFLFVFFSETIGTI